MSAELSIMKRVGISLRCEKAASVRLSCGQLKKGVGVISRLWNQSAACMYTCGSQCVRGHVHLFVCGTCNSRMAAQLLQPSEEEPPNTWAQ